MLRSVGVPEVVVFRQKLYTVVTLKLFIPESMLTELAGLGEPVLTVCLIMLCPCVSEVLESFVLCLMRSCVLVWTSIVVIVVEAAAPLTFTLFVVRRCMLVWVSLYVMVTLILTVCMVLL